MSLVEVSSERRTQASRRADATRSLLDAAAVLFAERGIDQTSLADIGELAGYSRGLANHHFGSKAALIEQLIEHCQTTFLAFLQHPSGASAREEIEGIAEAYVRHFEEPHPGSRAFLVMWGASFPSENSVTSIRAADRWVRDRVEDYVRAGRKDGSIDRSVDPGAFSIIFIGLIRGVSGVLLTNADDADFKAIRKQLRALIDGYLRPKGS